MFLSTLFLLFYVSKLCYPTIDINLPELQYLADHLTPEQCRRLVAAAHFQSYDEPNALDQAERQISKDIPCIDSLLHWNSNEGKGQTHQVLELRLRQMGLNDLADWLGKTVFHQLGVDLESGIEQGVNVTESEETQMTTEYSQTLMEPLVPKIENPSSYSIFDYVLYAFAVGLFTAAVGICLKLCCESLRKSIKKRKLKKHKNYDFIESDETGSEYEDDKFDVRNYGR